MTFERTTVIVVACDGCGPDWWVGEFDDQPRFVSKPAARRVLTDTYGWEFTRRLDGTFQMLCCGCADRADCDTNGHRWMTAQEAAEIGAAPVCLTCGTPRAVDAPPVGHPDAVPLLLPDAAEEALAALDAHPITYDFTEGS